MVFCHRDGCRKRVPKKESIELHYYTNGFTTHFCSLECFELWVWENFLSRRAAIQTLIVLKETEH